MKVLTDMIDIREDILLKFVSKIIILMSDDGLIKKIYQKCKNLKYLEIPFKDDNLLEFENLLFNCQYLSGLVINNNKDININKLFEILVNSSPVVYINSNLLILQNLIWNP
jgi:hypothetical protein